MDARPNFYAFDVTKTSVVGIMEHKGFKAALMRAPRLTGTGRHGLPPGFNCPIWPVDALPGAPEDWVRGPGSYVCPVESDWGLWFSWTMNDNHNTAILPSVKGMNPITGEKLEGFTLDQYVEKCPKHKEPFKSGLYCEKCGYKWPPQSYVSYPNKLWWDGFRQADGSVRQFFFTEDEERDIASKVIGKKNTVPAFGFAFYETIKKREVQRSPLRGFAGGQSVQISASSLGSFGGVMADSCETVDDYKQFLDSMDGKLYSKGGDMGPTWQAPQHDSGSTYNNMVTPENKNMNMVTPDNMTLCSESEEKTSGPLLSKPTLHMKTRSKQLKGSVMRPQSLAGGRLTGTTPNPPLVTKAVSVGAGAEIDQELVADTLAVDGWQTKPSGVIRLYFVFEKQFREIVKAGVKDLTGDKKGYLKDLPVG